MCAFRLRTTGPQRSGMRVRAGGTALCAFRLRTTGPQRSGMRALMGGACPCAAPFNWLWGEVSCHPRPLQLQCCHAGAA